MHNRAVEHAGGPQAEETLRARQPAWTTDEFKAFEKLVDGTSSRNQVVRISARLDMNTFVAAHGKEKCDAMFAELTKNDK